MTDTRDDSRQCFDRDGPKVRCQMSWLFLFVAGLCEVAWAVGLKHLQVAAQPLGYAVTGVLIALSLFLLSLALKHLPLGTAYAMWTGIGALGTFAVGVLWYHEPLSAARVISFSLVLCGLIGLKLTSN